MVRWRGRRQAGGGTDPFGTDRRDDPYRVGPSRADRRRPTPRTRQRDIDSHLVVGCARHHGPTRASPQFHESVSGHRLPGSARGSNYCRHLQTTSGLETPLFGLPNRPFPASHLPRGLPNAHQPPTLLYCPTDGSRITRQTRERDANVHRHRPRDRKRRSFQHLPDWGRPRPRRQNPGSLGKTGQPARLVRSVEYVPSRDRRGGRPGLPHAAGCVG